MDSLWAHCTSTLGPSAIKITKTSFESNSPFLNFGETIKITKIHLEAATFPLIKLLLFLELIIYKIKTLATFPLVNLLKFSILNEL